MRRGDLVGLLCGALYLLAGCPVAGPPDGGLVDDGGPADGGSAPDALYTLDEVADWSALADEDGWVKFLLPVAGEVQPPVEGCVFQNTARFPYHLPFLQGLPGGEDITYDDYLAWVLRRETRVWWGGQVRWQPDQAHPLREEPGALVYAFYTEDSPGNRLVIDDVRGVHARLVECAPVFADELAFAPSSMEQRQAAASFVDALAAEGVAVVDPGEAY